MKCKRQINWVIYTFEFQASEIQAIINCFGWSIVNTFSEMTEEDKTELYRLEYEIKGVWAHRTPTDEQMPWLRRHMTAEEPVNTVRKCVVCGSAPTTDPESPICGDCLVETVEHNLDAMLGE